jgi:hypothetical protein
VRNMYLSYSFHATANSVLHVRCKTCIGINYKCIHTVFTRSFGPGGSVVVKALRY